MITIPKKLDMSPHGIPQVINVSQYDSDFSIQFKLYASVGTLTIESGTTAEIRGTKGSGTGYNASATINVSNNTVTVAGDAQMTAVAGRNTFEIVLKKSGKVLGSANFVLLVERAALDADTITDASVLRELNAIIEGAETATQAAEDAEDAADRAEAAAQTLVTDSTLSRSGQAADAKATGDAIAGLEDEIAQIVPGLSSEAKDTLLTCFQHVAWIDEHGGSYYNALRTALYSEGGSTPVISEYPRLLASYSPPSYFKLYIGDSISILKNFLTVILYTSASESEVVTEYELSGSINSETNVINVTYNGMAASFIAEAEAWTFDSDCLVVGNWILQNTYATYEASSLNRMTLNPLLKRMPIGTYTLSFSNSDYEYGAQFAIAATPKLFEASETLLTEGTESTVWTGSSLTKNWNVSGFPGGYQTGDRTFEITDPECFMVLNIRKKDLSNITASLKQQIKSALTIIKTA